MRTLGEPEIAMATVTVEVPDSAFSALRRSPEEFARDMRIAAAIQWYHQRLISQSKGAAIAGLSRRDFLTALNHAKVEASQVDIEEMKEDVERDLQSRRERLASDLFDQSGAARSATGAECPSPGA
jgi:predicted HTH domain antitoxin